MSLKEIMVAKCLNKNCQNVTPVLHSLCRTCQESINEAVAGKAQLSEENIPARRTEDVPLSELYPKYYKAIPKNWDSIDVYGVHMLFGINDPSGAIQHASKKLLLSGVRTGGKSQRDDIREARDTLNRWLQMN